MTGTEQLLLQAYTFFVLVAVPVGTLVLIVAVRRWSACPHPLREPTFNDFGHRVGYRCSRCGERLPTIFRSA